MQDQWNKHNDHHRIECRKGRNDRRLPSNLESREERPGTEGVEQTAKDCVG